MAVDVVRSGRVGAGAVEARAQAAPWLADRRRRAYDLYERLPVPSAQRDEAWRRTDVSRLEPESFVADPGSTGHGATLVDHLRGLRDRLAPGAALVVSTRLGVRACEDSDALDAQGIIVGDLERLADVHPELVARGLAAVPLETNPVRHGGARFLALWHALWRGGVFVHVPAGVEARIPVVAAHSAAGERPAVFPATVVVLEPHSRLTLVELHASPASGGELLSDAVTALVVGEGAQLDHCIVQRWGAGARHIAHHRTVLDTDARVRTFVATLGAGLQKSFVEARLAGRGAEARIAGVVFGSGTQHLDHDTLQDHIAPDTTSDLLLKVAVRDTARSVYGGLVAVREAAQGTNAYVANRNLILSHGARATGIPRLEIAANDVRCSHGVTAGRVDEEQRFYLMARGIDADAADRLIVRGFMQDAIDRCPHPGVAGVVGELLDEAVTGALAAGIRAGDDDA